jgi:hypothetical protein
MFFIATSDHDVSPISHPGIIQPMRMNSLALAAILGIVVATPAFAQATSPEQDALLFLDSQVLPKKAAACAARITGYAAKFEPAFRSWLAANKEHLASGEAFLRADAQRTQVPFERDVQAVIGVISQQWTSAPLSVLQENCEAMLLQLIP